MKFTYLLLDGLTLLPTLLFSFHPRIGFYRHWSTYLPAMLITAGAFILWDSYFSRMGIWGFNPGFLTGHYIGNLPVEEWLFFACIPYACVFTAYCHLLAGGRGPGARTERLITTTLLGTLLVLAFWNLRHRYTSTTCLSLSLVLIFCSYFFKAGLLGRFYVSWLILLLPLLVVDGILTGTGLHQPVVWYNPKEIIGVRVLTIPVEDFFYGMELMLMNVLMFYLLQRIGRGRRNQSATPDLI